MEDTALIYILISLLFFVILLSFIGFFLIAKKIGLLSSKLEEIRNNSEEGVRSLEIGFQQAFENINSKCESNHVEAISSTKSLAQSLLKAYDSETSKLFNSISEVRANIGKDISNLGSVLQQAFENISSKCESNHVEAISSTKSLAQSLLKAYDSETNKLLNSVSENNDLISSSNQAAQKRLEGLALEVTNSIEGASKRLMIIVDEINESLSKDSNNKFLTILEHIQFLRVANTIQESRNQYGEGRITIENSSFCKVFDDCRLIEIEDKETKQKTFNEYNEGVLTLSKTYENGQLKYISKYKSGNLESMEEISSTGKVIAKYTYDEAGEISAVEEY